MTDAISQNTPRVDRLRRRRRLRLGQFSLLGLIVLVAAAGLFSRWYLYRPSPKTRVDIHVLSDSVKVDTKRASWNQLASVLAKRRIHIESAAGLGGARVRLTVDDSATYGDFKRAVVACWDSRLRPVDLKTSDRTECYYVLLPRGYAPSETAPSIPPFSITLEADDRGGPPRIKTSNRPNSTLAQLHADALAFVGGGRPAGPLREMAEIEFKCEDAISFKHVRAVLEAMAQPLPAGPRVPLIRRLKLRLPNPEDDFWSNIIYCGPRFEASPVAAPEFVPVIPPVEVPPIGELKLPKRSSDHDD